MKNIIDCHTHLQTNKLAKEYFSNRSGFAIVIKALDSLIGNGNQIYKTIEKFDNLFLCECIDAFSNNSIESQLEKIEKKLKKNRVIGIKIYLGYQPIFADDERLFPVYQFAKAHNLSIVLHCGVLAENFKNDEQINYSSSLNVGKIAKLFPTVNFIVSHFDYPNFEDCIEVVLENKNVFTDISGQYENMDNEPYDKLVNTFIEEISTALQGHDKSKIVNKVMFGTDYFGKGSGFDVVEEYIVTLDILFGKENQNLYLYENCLRAYPKIKEFIGKK